MHRGRCCSGVRRRLLREVGVSTEQKVLRPFAEQGHYVKIFDPIFDEIMPNCPPNAFKVLLFVIRKTRGWAKDSDRLSVGQIQRGTGISSENTARAALAWLLEQQMILKVDGYSSADHVAYEYALNTEYEITLAEGDTSRKFRGRATSRIAVGAGANSAVGAASEIEGHNSHPKKQPSVNNNDGGDPAPSSADKITGRNKSTEHEHRKRVEDWLARDPLADELAEIINRATARNASGRMTWSRKWNGHIKRVEDWRKTYSEAAIRYALEETNRMEKWDIRYAGGVLRHNPDGPPVGNGSAPAPGKVTPLRGSRSRSLGHPTSVYDEAAY